MKIKIRLLLFSLLLLSGLTLHAEGGKPFVVPELKTWKAGHGELTLASSFRVVYAESSLRAVAVSLAKDYQTMFGGEMPAVVTGKAGKGDVVLRLKADKGLGTEGYTLNVTDRVLITAPQTIGAYWGTRTLLQLLEQGGGRHIPKGEARDFPDYALRGVMVDCGRKFIPMNYLQDLVKMLAYYKMNVLQLHLNDNGFKQFYGHDWDKTYAAFRLECETFPGLTARDGSYSKKAFMDFQDMAAAHFVEVIPEIDAPAHTLAFSHYKPELGSKEYGMDHLDLFNPESYRFMDALFKEYLSGSNPVFKGRRVHIGTDEYSNKKPEVVEKFRYFTDRYIKLVESYGK